MSISRYPTTVQRTLVDADGRTVPYLPRTFLPQPGTVGPTATLVVAPGQRFDHVAAIALGDAELSWALAYANGVERLTDLAVSGRAIAVPTGDAIGRFT